MIALQFMDDFGNTVSVMENDDMYLQNAFAWDTESKIRCAEMMAAGFDL